MSTIETCRLSTCKRNFRKSRPWQDFCRTTHRREFWRHIDREIRALILENKILKRELQEGRENARLLSEWIEQFTALVSKGKEVSKGKKHRTRKTKGKRGRG